MANIVPALSADRHIVQQVGPCDQLRAARVLSSEEISVPDQDHSSVQPPQQE